MARLIKHTKRGQTVWSIRWQDATRDSGHGAWMDVYCTSKNHDAAFQAAGLTVQQRVVLANSATNITQRQMLLEAYDALELSRLRDAEQARAVRKAPAFDMPVTAFLDACEEYLDYREALAHGGKLTALKNDIGWRGGRLARELRKSSARETRRAIAKLREWLPPNITTGEFDGEVLRDFMMFLRHNGASAKTLNNRRADFRSLFFALTTASRKRMFRTDPVLWFHDEVEALPVSQGEITIYSPQMINAFLEEARKRGTPKRKVVVRRERNGKTQEFEQPISAKPAPVLEWALLLACTGMRRSEAERLRWADVDLDYGVIRVYDHKRNRVRYVPLTGDPAGDIAPGMMDTLRAWRLERPTDTHVLPSESGTPLFPSHGWDECNKDAGVKVTPQGLRRTFESMLAAIGFPAGLTAFWLGHSVQIAEKHYRAYRPGRLPGSTVDAALGLAPLMKQRVGGTTLPLLPRLGSDALA
ncbi:MAG: tyrosine-type recombinase/integrase [Planctomycetota bacterium]